MLVISLALLTVSLLLWKHGQRRFESKPLRQSCDRESRNVIQKNVAADFKFKSSKKKKIKRRLSSSRSRYASKQSVTSVSRLDGSGEITRSAPRRVTKYRSIRGRKARQRPNPDALFSVSSLNEGPATSHCLTQNIDPSIKESASHQAQQTIFLTETERGESCSRGATTPAPLGLSSTTRIGAVSDAHHRQPSPATNHKTRWRKRLTSFIPRRSLGGVGGGTTTSGRAAPFSALGGKEKDSDAKARRRSRVSTAAADDDDSEVATVSKARLDPSLRLAGHDEANDGVLGRRWQELPVGDDDDNNNAGADVAREMKEPCWDAELHQAIQDWLAFYGIMDAPVNFLEKTTALSVSAPYGGGGGGAGGGGGGGGIGGIDVGIGGIVGGRGHQDQRRLPIRSMPNQAVFNQQAILAHQADGFQENKVDPEVSRLVDSEYRYHGKEAILSEANLPPTTSVSISDDCSQQADEGTDTSNDCSLDIDTSATYNSSSAAGAVPAGLRNVGHGGDCCSERQEVVYRLRSPGLAARRKKIGVLEINAEDLPVEIQDPKTAAPRTRAALSPSLETLWHGIRRQRSPDSTASGCLAGYLTQSQSSTPPCQNRKLRPFHNETGCGRHLDASPEVASNRQEEVESDSRPSEVEPFRPEVNLRQLRDDGKNGSMVSTTFRQPAVACLETARYDENDEIVGEVHTDLNATPSPVAAYRRRVPLSVNVKVETVQARSNVDSADDDSDWSILNTIEHGRRQFSKTTHHHHHSSPVGDFTRRDLDLDAAQKRKKTTASTASTDFITAPHFAFDMDEEKTGGAAETGNGTANNDVNAAEAERLKRRPFSDEVVHSAPSGHGGQAGEATPVVAEAVKAGVIGERGQMERCSAASSESSAVCSQVGHSHSVRALYSMSIAQRALLAEIGIYSEIVEGRVILDPSLIRSKVEDQAVCPWCVLRQKTRRKESNVNNSNPNQTDDLHLASIESGGDPTQGQGEGQGDGSKTCKRKRSRPSRHRRHRARARRRQTTIHTDLDLGARFERSRQVYLTVVLVAVFWQLSCWLPIDTLRLVVEAPLSRDHHEDVTSGAASLGWVYPCGWMGLSLIRMAAQPLLYLVLGRRLSRCYHSHWSHSALP